MTVAAVVLAASPESALADADGVARVRRIADAAWAGGAVPIVVVSLDPGGDVAAALAGAPVSLAEPAPAAGGPVAQVCRGIDLARHLVTETVATLIWPARMCWVGPETVTSLIEAHGPEPGAILAPAYRADRGWPVLLPLAHLERLRGLPAGSMPDELIDALIGAGVPNRSIELGDPGTVTDGRTPRADLPRYDGPPEPAAGHTHEWGAAVADLPEDLVVGPAIVPYPAE